jgi:hypothetical protein
MHELLRVDGTTDMYVAILSTAASSPCDLDMEGFEQTTNKSVYDRSFLRSTKQQMFIIKVIEIRCVALGSDAWSRTAPRRVWPSEADDVRDRMGSRDVFLVGIRAPGEEAAAIRRMLCFAPVRPCHTRLFASSHLRPPAHPLLASGHGGQVAIFLGKPANNAMISCYAHKIYNHLCCAMESGMNCSLLVSAIRPFDFFSSYFLKARSVLLIALAWDSCYQGIAFFW